MITKQELYLRSFPLNSLAAGVSCDIRVRKGSGGGPSKGTSTFPLAQHIPGGSDGHFLA